MHYFYNKIVIPNTATMVFCVSEQHDGVSFLPYDKFFYFEIYFEIYKKWPKNIFAKIYLCKYIFYKYIFWPF